MPLTKAQLGQALDLFERFVEAHEAIAEAAVIMTTPTTKVSPVPQPTAATTNAGGKTPTQEPGGGSGLDLGLDLSDDDETSTGGKEDSADQEQTQPADDVPAASESTLDLGDKAAVDEFREQTKNALIEFDKEGGDVPALLEEVTGSEKFSAVTDEQLEELHDSVFDAIAELK